MELSKVRSFSKKKIYIGQFFPDEKKLEELNKSGTELESAEEKVKAYLDSIKTKEYLVFREAASDEIASLNENGYVSDNVLKNVNERVQLEIVRTEQAASKDYLPKMKSLLKSTLIGSSFTDGDGAESSVDEVFEAIASNSKMLSYVMSEWSKSQGN